MASTTALFTGLSGLSVNARRLDVIGNNIANVNTIAFKSSRMIFAPTFSRNLSPGTAPGDNTGGTNPGQIGLGASIAGTQRNFNNGSISATGLATDVAIEGDGFFIVDRAGEQLYTRAGAFQLNSRNDLVTISGERVQGFGVDPQFNIIEGTLTDLNIPLGTLTLAEATRNVIFNGNLNASGVVATTGSVHSTRALLVDDDGDPLTVPGAPAAATGATDLTDGTSHLFIDDGTGSLTLALESGAQAVVTISGVEKGGKDLGAASFGFSATPIAGVDRIGTDLDDFMTFLDEYLGLSDVADGQPLGGSVAINGSGEIVITGNEGTVQDLDIETADLVVTYAGTPTGTPLNEPFVLTKGGDADGESVRTSFAVYDSLGTPLNVDLSFVLQETTPGEGSTWKWIAESSDNDELDRALGVGIVTFDADGRFVSATNQSFSMTRSNGAIDPLAVAMDFDSGTDAITALADTMSTLAAVSQDGSAIGTLSQFSIGENGEISGSFTNGLSRTIGQIALAKFPNAEGLVDAGNNLLRIGPNSGTAIITGPLAFGTGRLLGGALELSNVDLSQEFINLILTSTGYSASSRVITTTDELIDQLLILGR